MLLENISTLNPATSSCTPKNFRKTNRSGLSSICSMLMAVILKAGILLYTSENAPPIVRPIKKQQKLDLTYNVSIVLLLTLFSFRPIPHWLNRNYITAPCTTQAKDLKNVITQPANAAPPSTVTESVLSKRMFCSRRLHIPAYAYKNGKSIRRFRFMYTDEMQRLSLIQADEEIIRRCSEYDGYYYSRYVQTGEAVVNHYCYSCSGKCWRLAAG